MRCSAEEIRAALWDLCSSEMTGEDTARAAELKIRRMAVADDRVLYHVMHPVDMAADLWTPDCVLAWGIYEQFVRRYGAAHLHREILHARQYDAECLARIGAEATGLSGSDHRADSMRLEPLTARRARCGEA